MKCIVEQGTCRDDADVRTNFSAYRVRKPHLKPDNSSATKFGCLAVNFAAPPLLKDVPSICTLIANKEYGTRLLQRRERRFRV